MKSKFSFTWHSRPSRLIPLHPSPSLPDSARSVWLPSPDPRHALVLSWEALSARGDIPFLASLWNWAILPLLSPNVFSRESCFPDPVLRSCSWCRRLSPTLLKVCSRAGTLLYPSLILSPKPHVLGGMGMKVGESREGKEIATFLSFATREIYMKYP